MDVLNSDKSPYKNLCAEEEDKLIKAINNIEKIKSNTIGRPFYPFPEYTHEPEELTRIYNEIKQFKTIDPALHNLCLSYKC